jgi:soluble lytic murein transglycosylase-like protein
MVTSVIGGARRERVRFIKGVIMVGVAALLCGCSSTAYPGLASILPRHEGADKGTVVAASRPAVSPGGMDSLIAHYAAEYDVPEALIRRVIIRESGYNPKARNGPYYGLMQIRYDTAQSMGYRGPASGLLDADTNLHYGVRYLGGAYLVGGQNPDQAVRNYARGYYYDAKAKGLLDEVGLR